MTHKGVAPGHITNPHTTALHAKETQAHITTDETPHTEEPHHTEVLPGITVDPDHICHTNKTAKHHPNCLTALNRQPEKTDRKYKQVTIDDPPSEYYSSDEQSSESDEDLN